MLELIIIIAIALASCSPSHETEDSLNAYLARLECKHEMEELTPEQAFKESGCSKDMMCIQKYLDNWVDNCVKRKLNNDNKLRTLWFKSLGLSGF